MPARMSAAVGERPNAEADVLTKGSGGKSLPELLDQLELALAGTAARTSVCRALSDLNRRLGSATGKTADGRPCQFVLDRVKPPDEAQFLGCAPGPQGSLRHLQANQVIGDQDAPELLADALHGLAAKGQPCRALTASIHGSWS